MFLFLLSRIMMPGLLLGMVLSVCTCWSYNMITLPSWLVSTNFGTCSYQLLLLLFCGASSSRSSSSSSSGSSSRNSFNVSILSASSLR
jgi:uncharacterized membrane protein YgcG